jgi:hypothetical protein
MKLILLSLVASFTFATSSSPSSSVYICNGPASKKYHLKEDCRGLDRCSTKIEKVTLEQAKEKGRTICGYEN